MLRNLATTLALHGKVETTSTKAKALVAYYERMITLAKRKSDAYHPVRVVKQYLYTKPAQKAFVDRLKTLTRESGHLRTVKMGYRKGDAAPLMLVEFVS